MPDATEFLIEYLDSESETRYERIADSDDAIEYLRQLVGQGKAAILYQRVPFEVQIGVTVKAPRKRRKTPSPADKPDSDAPSGPGNGEAGEPEGAASPQAAERGGTVPAGAETVEPTTSPVVLPAPAASLWVCEANFPDDLPCPGPVEFDPATRGRFCGLHAAVPEAFRREMHRLHKHRNAPAAAVVRLVG